MLESYLERVHGPDWHAAFAARRAAGSGAGAGDAAGGSGRMTPAEAREVLGVSDTASPEAIREAHHRLMKKLHPDLGGSTYLASRVNAAKDVLLGA